MINTDIKLLVGMILDRDLHDYDFDPVMNSRAAKNIKDFNFQRLRAEYLDAKKNLEEYMGLDNI